MKLESSGILLQIKKFAEHDAILHVFTYDYGLVVGLLHGGGKSGKKVPLIGQVGQISWNARLETQLGVLHWEAEQNLAVPVMQNTTLLSIFNSVIDLLLVLLPEREKNMILYNATFDLLNSIADKTFDMALELYLQWELVLLYSVGYALDLTHCAGCDTTMNLCYLSPKTGHAVCSNCAKPYVDKLYKLPVNLMMTLNFLEIVCAQQDISVPASRYFLQKKHNYSK